MSRVLFDDRDRSTPWTAADVQMLVVLGTSGVVVTALGWFLVSGRATYESQMDAIGLGVFGVVLAGFATLFWILSGRRAVAQRLQRLMSMRTELHGTVGLPAGAQKSGDDRFFVAGHDSTFFHTADCGLALARGWQPAGREEHEMAGRTPCGVCIR